MKVCLIHRIQLTRISNYIQLLKILMLPQRQANINNNSILRHKFSAKIQLMQLSKVDMVSSDDKIVRIGKKNVREQDSYPLTFIRYYCEILQLTTSYLNNSIYYSTFNIHKVLFLLMVSVTLQVVKRWDPLFENHPFQDTASNPVVQSQQVAHSTLRITQTSSNSWPNLLGMVSCFKAGQCFRFL